MESVNVHPTQSPQPEQQTVMVSHSFCLQRISSGRKPAGDHRRDPVRFQPATCPSRSGCRWPRREVSGFVLHSDEQHCQAAKLDDPPLLWLHEIEGVFPIDPRSRSNRRSVSSSHSDAAGVFSPRESISSTAIAGFLRPSPSTLFFIRESKRLRWKRC